MTCLHFFPRLKRHTEKQERPASILAVSRQTHNGGAPARSDLPQGLPLGGIESVVNRLFKCPQTPNNNYYSNVIYKVLKKSKNCRDVARGLDEKWNFLHCVGGLDGKQINIILANWSGQSFRPITINFVVA